jgi:hypothetical protein
MRDRKRQAYHALLFWARRILAAHQAPDDPCSALAKLRTIVERIDRLSADEGRRS